MKCLSYGGEKFSLCAPCFCNISQSFSQQKFCLLLNKKNKRIFLNSCHFTKVFFHALSNALSSTKFHRNRGAVNWPATQMNGVIVQTIPKIFVANHEKPQPFCFAGNMRTSRPGLATNQHSLTLQSEETSTFSKAVVARL